MIQTNSKVPLLDSRTKPSSGAAFAFLQVERYYRDLQALKPMLDRLNEEVDALNEFEEVVKLPITDVPKIRQLAGEVAVVEELFVWTKNFHEHQEYVTSLSQNESENGTKNRHPILRTRELHRLLLCVVPLFYSSQFETVNVGFFCIVLRIHPSVPSSTAAERTFARTRASSSWRLSWRNWRN